MTISQTPRLFLFLALSGIIGCMPKPRSLGDEGGLVIVADELDRPLIARPVDRTFGRIFETPQDEPLFSITYIDADELDSKSRSPLIILFSAIDGDGPTAKFARKMLTGKVLEGVKSGEYFIFKRSNQWASDQLFLILVGIDQTNLAQNVSEWCDTLYAWSREFELKRLETEMFRRGSNTEIEKSLLSRYKYRMKVQKDYLIAREDDSLNYVRLIRHYPDRWLLIARREMSSPGQLTPEYIYNWRQSLAPTFLDPVSTYDEHWAFDTTHIAGYSAYRVRGLWQTLDPTGGGPFFTYGFWSEQEKSCYILDGAVFAPGKLKMPYIWQLDVMAHSFSAELTK